MTAQAFNPIGQCHGKRPYRTKKIAKRIVKASEATFHTRMRAYHCPHCLWYHVGHKPPKGTT